MLQSESNWWSGSLLLHENQHTFCIEISSQFNFSELERDRRNENETRMRMRQSNKEIEYHLSCRMFVDFEFKWHHAYLNIENGFEQRLSQIARRKDFAVAERIGKNYADCGQRSPKVKTRRLQIARDIYHDFRFVEWIYIVWFWLRQAIISIDISEQIQMTSKLCWMVWMGNL